MFSCRCLSFKFYNKHERRQTRLRECVTLSGPADNTVLSYQQYTFPWAERQGYESGELYEWRMENGEWRVESGEWRVVSV